jgi:hypothetical protein
VPWAADVIKDLLLVALKNLRPQRGATVMVAFQRCCFETKQLSVRSF